MRQSRLVESFDNHPGRPDIIKWLRDCDGETWDEYLDKFAPGQAASA